MRIAERRTNASLRSIVSFVLAVSIFLAGCSRVPQSLLVWTDIPELVIAAQLFNRTESRYVVDIEYHDNPALDLLFLSKSKPRPSLVIGRFLQSAFVAQKFEVIDDIFSRYYLDPNDIYPGLLAGGREGARQRLIPISFDPYVLVEKRIENANSGLSTIQLDELAVNASKTGRNERGVLVSLGFSPWWDTGFAISLLLAHGTAFSSNPAWKTSSVPKLEDIRTWPLAWDDAGLRKGLEALLGLGRALPGKEELEAFEFDHGNQPGYQRVLSGAARFWPMRASEFFKLPQNVRSQLAYRYPLVYGNLVFSAESRYMGIPGKAPAREAALFFARWLLSLNHQKEIWTLMQEQHLNSSHFGPFDGFGSLIQANEMLVPEFFPSYVQNRIGSAVKNQGKYPGVPYQIPFFWDDFSSECLDRWTRKLHGFAGIADEQTAVEHAIAALKEQCVQYLGTMPDWMKASP